MRFLLFLFLSSLLSGCETYLISTKDKPDCPTTISGYFESIPLYAGIYPVVILKKNDYEVLHGTILALTDSFVLFDEDKGVYLFDPEPKKYSISDIAAVVNERGINVYGTIPKKYLISWRAELDIRKEGETSELKFTRFRLIPNQPFSYCIEPGNYRSRILYLISDRGDVQFCNPQFWFPIVEAKNNCFGKIILDPDRVGESDSNNIGLQCIVQKPATTSGIGAAIDLLTPTKYVIRLIAFDINNYSRNSEIDTLINLLRGF